MPRSINNANQPYPFLREVQENAQPGDRIEVINVSEAPETAYHQADAVTLEVDESGQFKGELANLHEGDYLQVRTRSSNGSVSSWLSVQANGIGEDTRNAQMGPRGLGIKAFPGGTLRPVHLGGGALSEPNAQLRFTNLRTGEHTDVSLDGKGHLPLGVTLNGEVGDDFQIAVNDGVNNNDFNLVLVNTVQVKDASSDLDDPVASDRYMRGGQTSLKKVRFQGPLFVDGAKSSDVKQGSLGNCYFCAAAAAVAHVHPEVIENMMTDNGDGTYTVTFNVETPPDSGTYEPQSVTVDGELYVSHGNNPTYGGSTTNSGNRETMEMWFPILEKAFSQLNNGSYQNIESGWSHKAMMMLTGATVNDEHFLPNKNLDDLFASLMEAQENGWPGSAVTYTKNSSEGSRYSGSRIYADHAYSVLGAKEENGQRYVQLRNPWGNSEPGNDGKNDGIFWLELEQFPHYFQWCNVTHAPS
ncbi:MAG: hypothetical protein EP343_07315 [Deltaproteobacteria bacterium]|nr:MAG: hypothetical protein EP343_07315 [Deltaproteobacteria bacterium]